jgi:hypothetical protein
MTALMRKILEDKRRGRADLAARPVAEKVAVLEQLRARRELVAAGPLRRASVAQPVWSPGAKP